MVYFSGHSYNMVIVLPFYSEVATKATLLTTAVVVASVPIPEGGVNIE